MNVATPTIEEGQSTAFSHIKASFLASLHARGVHMPYGLAVRPFLRARKWQKFITVSYDISGAYTTALHDVDSRFQFVVLELAVDCVDQRPCFALK
jgi:hypothetical protein